MTWYIVVRDTDSGREYLCDDRLDLIWLSSKETVHTFRYCSDAEKVAKWYGGTVVTLKEVAP